MTTIEKFIAQRVIDGKNTYVEVITKRPDLKEGINEYLTQQNRVDLIKS